MRSKQEFEYCILLLGQIATNIENLLPTYSSICEKRDRQNSGNSSTCSEFNLVSIGESLLRSIVLDFGILFGVTGADQTNIRKFEMEQKSTDLVKSFYKEYSQIIEKIKNNRNMIYGHIDYKESDKFPMTFYKMNYSENTHRSNVINNPNINSEKYLEYIKRQGYISSDLTSERFHMSDHVADIDMFKTLCKNFKNLLDSIQDNEINQNTILD